MRSTHVALIGALVTAVFGAPTGTSWAAPAPAEPKTVIDADGSYTVGTDIVAGTYRSAGPLSGGTCYWKRVRGNEIVDNALTKKPQLVQIEPTDTVFKTDGCQPWQKTECPPDCAPPPAAPALPGELKDFLAHPPQPAPG